MLQPTAIILQAAFLLVLFLFVAWVARSTLRDLKRPDEQRSAGPPPADATGIHSAVTAGAAPSGPHDPRLVVERAPGHTPGMEYEVGNGAILGRGEQAEIRLDDPYASSRHARLSMQGGRIVLEDLGSTNGTFLNEEIVSGPQPLHQGDHVRIGDSEFHYVDN
ncbi:MAG: FHA domain-containing protein [Actinomycetes bacterium]